MKNIEQWQLKKAAAETERNKEIIRNLDAKTAQEGQTISGNSSKKSATAG